MILQSMDGSEPAYVKSGQLELPALCSIGCIGLHAIEIKSRSSAIEDTECCESSHNRTQSV